MRLQHVLATLVLSGLAVGTASADVALKRGKDVVHVLIDGKPFTDYVTSKELPKPFFADVTAPDGTVISRPVPPPKGEDHPWHKGLFVAVDQINKERHWAELSKIENESVELVKSEGNPAVLKVTNKWTAMKEGQFEPGSLIVTEVTTISIYENRLLVYEIEFKAGDTPLEFGDTKEGLFGFRMMHTMREKEGGTVINSEGVKTAKACWGKPAAWVDYFGPVDGKVHGITLMDSPKNFRPSRYHVRDYGLFSINPFGVHSYTGGELPPDHAHVKPHESLKLTYGCYIHQGDTEEGDVPAAYQQFLKVTGAK